MHIVGRDRLIPVAEPGADAKLIADALRGYCPLASPDAALSLADLREIAVDIERKLAERESRGREHAENKGRSDPVPGHQAREGGYTAGSHPAPSKLLERFWSKVDRKGPDECWLWTAGATSKGYGTFDIEDRTWRAHRVAWMLDNAMQDPGDLCVLHSCDTRLCVNPSHLFLGTNDENVADRDAKGRQARGSDNGGTKLTEDQVRDIRRRLSEGQVMAEIARVYGVQDSTIRDIREGVTWSHLKAGPSTNLDALLDLYEQRQLKAESEVERLQGMATHWSEAEIAAKARAEKAEAELAKLRDHHVNAECSTCGVRDCVGGEPLHYHHDGCPYEYGLQQRLEQAERERDEALKLINEAIEKQIDAEALVAAYEREPTDAEADSIIAATQEIAVTPYRRGRQAIAKWREIVKKGVKA